MGSVYMEPLSVWDVVAAIAGLGVAIVSAHFLHLGGYTFRWVGAPAALIAARRAWFPDLTPRPDKPPPSLGRRIRGYACMIFGGFIALLSGIGVLATFSDTHATDMTAAFIVLGVFAFGAGLVLIGVRQLA
jgi:hypothetical protein